MNRLTATGACVAHIRFLCRFAVKRRRLHILYPELIGSTKKMQQTAPNQKHHLHCTRCKYGSACTDPTCKQKFMHHGQRCSHGFQVLDGQPECPVHCAWMAIASLLERRKWSRRNGQCMSNIVLNQQIGLSQHADMPPRDAPETLDQVLDHINASQECKQALEIARTFMLQQRAALGGMEAPQIAHGTRQESLPESAQDVFLSISEARRLPGNTPAIAVRIEEDWPALVTKKLFCCSRWSGGSCPKRVQPNSASVTAAS